VSGRPGQARSTRPDTGFQAARSGHPWAGTRREVSQ